MDASRDLKDFEVNIECVEANVESLGKSLNELVSRYNRDQRFQHPVIMTEEGNPPFDPVTGAFVWRYKFEAGLMARRRDGEYIDGLWVWYYPNPQKELELTRDDDFSFLAREEEERWKLINPKIDLSTGLYEISGHVVSNSSKKLLEEVVLIFEQLALCVRYSK